MQLRGLFVCVPLCGIFLLTGALSASRRFISGEPQLPVAPVIALHVRFTLPGNEIGVNQGTLNIQQWIEWHDPANPAMAETHFPDVPLQLDEFGNVDIPIAVPADAPGTLHIQASLTDWNGNPMWARSLVLELRYHDQIVAAISALGRFEPLQVVIESDTAP